MTVINEPILIMNSWSIVLANYDGINSYSDTHDPTWAHPEHTCPNWYALVAKLWSKLFNLVQPMPSIFKTLFYYLLVNNIYLKTISFVTWKFTQTSNNIFILYDDKISKIFFGIDLRNETLEID